MPSLIKQPGRPKSPIETGRYTFFIPHRLHQRLKLKAAGKQMGSMSALITSLLIAAFEKFPPKVETILVEAGVDLEAFYDDAELFSDIVKHLQGPFGLGDWALDVLPRVFKDRLPMKPETGVDDNGVEKEQN